jgi:hypothetical protein
MTIALILLSPPNVGANDFITACQQFGEAEVVFIGRPKPRVTRRISGEREVERAHEKWKALEAELLKTVAFKPPEIMFDVLDSRERALLQEMVNAHDEWSELVVRWPPAQNVELIPFEVESSFRGVSTSEVLMLLGNVDEVQVGRSYLVFASTPFPTPEIASAHRPPEPIESADEALRFLSLAASGSPGATVYGSLMLPNREGLGGVSMRLTVEERVFHTVTRADGSFMFTGIPAGSVEITLDLPNDLTLGRRGNFVSREVYGGGCVSLLMNAKPNGRLRGQVFHDDGTPLGHGTIRIQQERTTIGYAEEVRTNERGEFEFAGVAPGTYVLGLNLSATPTTNVPYPPVYFPGTTDRSEATRIIVGNGTEQSGLEWRLTGRLPTGEIELLMETGGQLTTAASACVSTRSPGGGKTSSHSSTERISTVEGVRYRIVAYANTATHHFRSQPVDTIGAHGRRTLRLKATAWPLGSLLPDPCSL